QAGEFGDRAYNSDPLDEESRRDGIEMIAPHRANRSKLPTQGRRASNPLYPIGSLSASRLDAGNTPSFGALGVPFPECLGLCSTRLPRYRLQAILRQVSNLDPRSRDRA